MNLSNRKLRFILNIVLCLTVSVALFGALALTVSAQIGSNYGLEATARAAQLPVGNPSPGKIVAVIVNTLLGLLGSILVILIIYAGFLWMTAAGDEQKIGKAKKLLGTAVVGLIITLSAYIIAAFTIKNLSISTGMPQQAVSEQGNPAIPPPANPCNGVCLLPSQVTSNCQSAPGDCPEGQSCYVQSSAMFTCP